VGLTRAPGVEEALLTALMTKSDVWRSEDEVRGLTRTPGIAIYPDGMLTGLIFGARTPDDEIAWVQGVAQEPKLTLSYSRIVPDFGSGCIPVT
jgi:hypothetical protein